MALLPGQAVQGQQGRAERTLHPPPSTASCISLGTEECRTGLRLQTQTPLCLNQSLLASGASFVKLGERASLWGWWPQGQLMGAVTDLPYLLTMQPPASRGQRPGSMWHCGVHL